MTTTILEQMARAICRHEYQSFGGDYFADEARVNREVDGFWPDYVDQAKAALQPLLGELPEGVKIGGMGAKIPAHEGPDNSFDRAARTTQAIFHAMISAILEDQPTTTGEGA